MKNIMLFIKHAIQKTIIPATFFFIVFNLLAVTKTLILESYTVTPISVASVTVGALIMAKAILIADKLPLINLFSGKPLILGILWKTAIYGILAFLFRCTEELISLLSKHEGFGAAARHLISDVSWPHFWALQIWLMVALVLYNSVKELDNHFGAGSIRKAYLG